MASLGITKSLLALLSTVSAVSSAATPAHWAGFGRQQPGWPTSVADSVHNSTWSSFAEKTQRWSAYRAPTFDLVFLPESEADLSDGVSHIKDPTRKALC